MAASKVTRIRDLWSEVDQLDRRIGDVIDDIPGDGLGIGYQLSPETQQDLGEAIPQLREVLRLLQRVRAREVPRFNVYAEAHGAGAGR